jgi:hypothetical protein
VSTQLSILEPAVDPDGRIGLGTMDTCYGPQLLKAWLWMEMVPATDGRYAIKVERRVVAMKNGTMASSGSSEHQMDKSTAREQVRRHAWGTPLHHRIRY